ncbi:MAG: hypothetical protein QXS85_04855 [Acidilobaceae archaeon]
MRELSVTASGSFKVSDVLYPSFARPLFDISEDGRKAVKRWGFCSGAVMESEGGRITVRHESRECVDYGAYLAGSWVDVQSLEPPRGGALGELAGLLLEVYGSLGVSVSPRDDYAVFASIFLSRNTDYDRNTVRWVRELLYSLGDVSRAAELDGRRIVRLAGSSYQLRQLPAALRCYSSVRERVLRGEHRELLKCGNVGPKVYHSYLLHVLARRDVAPVDVNLVRFLESFNALEGALRKPEKRYCAKHSCDSCPLRGVCIESILRDRLGELLGWFQNAAYYHMGNYCRLGRCEECALRHLCSRVRGL